MKRAVAAGAFLVLMIAFSLVNTHFLSRLIERVSELAECVSQCVKEGQWLDAEERASEAESLWLSNSSYLHTMLKHRDVNAGTEKTLVLEMCVRLRDEDGACLAAAELKQFMDDVNANESLTAENIF